MALRWSLPDDLPGRVDDALQAYPRPLRSVLYRRGIDSAVAADRFLSKSADRMHDPSELPGMARATQLLADAIRVGTRIAVYGDYDADGVTATALLLEFLQEAGADVIHYLPDRFEEGYGLNIGAIDHLTAAGCRLLLTVDCGVRATSEIARAKAAGMTAIVTDHHHPGPELPAADAIINPRLPAASYPFEGLAGVGLAYKLAQALADRIGVEAPGHSLDLVAVGTVADLAPLVDENRALVAQGLEELNRGRRAGLEALRQVARLPRGRVTSTHIAFGLGPRLNAAGRMESAEQALQLLLAERDLAARPAAERLNDLNRERQRETREAFERAQELLGPAAEEAPLLLALDPSFHDGVVGLVASRLTEAFHRPSLVAREKGGLVRGSARSIPGFHITHALEQCADLLLEFGGHAAAAGFTLRRSEVDEFRERLVAHAEAAFEAEPPERELEVDATVELREMSEQVLAALEEFEPFGQGNEAPIFAAFDVRVLDKRQVGRDRSHLKLVVSDGARQLEAIAFRQGAQAADLGDRIDLAFRFEWNEYQGYRSPQLNVLALRAADPAG